MKKVLLTSVLCASALFAASDYNYEITPMVGGTYHEGNMKLERVNLNGGLAVGFNQQDTFFDQIEVGFLRSAEDVKYEYKDKYLGQDTGITRVFANLVKDYPLTSDLSAYALAGVGVELFDNELYDDINGGFLNYGAGLKYRITDRFALKLDARHVWETGHGHNTLLYNLGFAMPFGEVVKEAPKPQPVVKPKPKPAPVVKPKDSDGDGVIDANDKCPNTIKGAKVNKDGCLVLINLNINFDLDSAKIKPSYDSKLKAFANMMNNNKMLKATIKAYTDSTGTKAYNKKLSVRRAVSTVKALEALNVDASRLKAIGYGESNPIATNKTKEGRAKNRRVHAVVDR